ncbi:uncharacterized protein LOC134176579 [Corticium candelabrum]|uniref:uncharacterized protein LOC134176579 n=1 Tax=Corticium candelabrum TaxID=121492 RepID=UPI002E25EA5C|nr:uncharacterized protein LOC134176579 [Corticium candelabrum]
MDRRESEISAAKRILHDAMRHLERAEEGDTRQEFSPSEEVTNQHNQREGSRSVEGNQRVSHQSSSSGITSIAVEQRRLFGHGSRPRGCESRTPRGVKRKAPANSDRRKPYQLGHRKVWTFSVMCLADNQCDTPPSRDRKLELLAAGLGEKKVTLGQSDDYLEVHNTLLEHFPALESTGYEVMRLTARRQLEVIPSLDMTAIHLKTVFDQAKMYLRPIANSIDLETVDMHDSTSTDKVQPMVPCLHCGIDVEMPSLREHMKIHSSCDTKPQSPRRRSQEGRKGREGQKRKKQARLQLETRSETVLPASAVEGRPSMGERSVSVQEIESSEPYTVNNSAEQTGWNAFSSRTHVPGSGSSRDKSCQSPISQLKSIFPDHSTDFLQRAFDSYEMNTEMTVQAVLDNLIEIDVNDSVIDVQLQLMNVTA